MLISTEGIARSSITGFHRDKKVYGGVVINALENNVPRERKDVASSIKALITKHKSEWIDEVIELRDMLVHPPRGAEQLMFEMQLRKSNGGLTYLRAVAPHVGEVSIPDYAEKLVLDSERFSNSLLTLLRRAAQQGAPADRWASPRGD